MSVRALALVLLAYAVLLGVACLVLHGHGSLRVVPPGEQRIVASRWAGGRLIERNVSKPGGPTPAMAQFTSADVIEERVVAEGELSLDATILPLQLVAGLDGVMAELGDKTVFATTDDLLARQAYDRAGWFFDPSLGFGTNRALVLDILASQLGVTANEIEKGARVRRVRFQRSVRDAPTSPRTTAETLDRDLVRSAVRDAAHYLARSVEADGRYRYIVDAVSGQTAPGYNWPRHAGATYFLAQAAALLDDAVVRASCLRAAAILRDDMMQSCGSDKCIAEDNDVEIGSSALTLIAFSEIVRTGADASYRPAVVALAKFLRAQQRADGELRHLFNRATGKPIDVQFLYFTGEAALGLSRAHRITDDPEDLRAASRALSRLSGEGWSFFGSRYYFSEEHWTCQSMSDLWDRAPDADALAFCLRWHEYQRRLQREAGDSAFDAEGSFGFGPFVTPRVTPASSRGEAAGAALDVVKRDHSAAGRATAVLLEDELRRAIAFVFRAQLRPGPRHLFARPDDVAGAIPGSAVDLQLRIDYAQHAGSMMIRWLELTTPTPR